MQTYLKAFMLFIFLLGIFVACENEYPDSLWPPETEAKPDPVINEVTPTEDVFAGIDEITLIGNNFSSDIERNHVYFDGTSAKIISASTTELVVQAPKVTGDSLRIQVSVDGAIDFAEWFPFTLTSAVVEFSDFSDNDDPFGLAMDSESNLYVSLQQDKEGKKKKVVKVTPEGERQDYGKSSFDKASQMHIGPDGELYLVNLLQYIFSIPSGGGNDQLFIQVPGGVFDLDFDSNLNLYCGGSGSAIYNVNIDDGTSQTVAEYDTVSIRAVRVFNGYIYVAGKYRGTNLNKVQEGVWRNQILNADGDLGEKELVFDWAAKYPQYQIMDIEFAADGTMYIGTNAPQGIIAIDADGNDAPLYEGVLEPDSYSLCWANDSYLYVTRRGAEDGKKRILKINMRKEGAPYFARQ